MKFWSFLLTALAWVTSTPAQETKLSLAPQEKTVWEDDGVGTGFRDYSLNAGLSLGGAFGMKILGSSERHDFMLGSVHAGWIFSGVEGRDHWYRGNWELVGELFGGGQMSPNSAYVIGFTPLFRYDFSTGSRWMPFVEGGVGVTATDIRGPDLSTTFQFNVMAGAGVHYFLRDNLALTLESRALHFSNARIDTPNLGVNSLAVLAGISWWF